MYRIHDFISVLTGLGSSKTGTQIQIFRSVTSEILFLREWLRLILPGMCEKFSHFSYNQKVTTFQKPDVQTFVLI